MPTQSKHVTVEDDNPNDEIDWQAYKPKTKGKAPAAIAPPPAPAPPGSPKRRTTASRQRQTSKLRGRSVDSLKRTRASRDLDIGAIPLDFTKQLTQNTTQETSQTMPDQPYDTLLKSIEDNRATIPTPPTSRATKMTDAYREQVHITPRPGDFPSSFFLNKNYGEQDIVTDNEEVGDANITIMSGLKMGTPLPREKVVIPDHINNLQDPQASEGEPVSLEFLFN